MNRRVLDSRRSHEGIFEFDSRLPGELLTTAEDAHVIHVKRANTHGHISVVLKEVRYEDTAAPWLLSSVALSVLKACPDLNVPSKKGDLGAHINTVFFLRRDTITIMVTLQFLRANNATLSAIMRLNLAYISIHSAHVSRSDYD